MLSKQLDMKDSGQSAHVLEIEDHKIGLLRLSRASCLNTVIRLIIGMHNSKKVF